PARSLVDFTELVSKPWKTSATAAPPGDVGAPGGDCQAAVVLQLASVELFQTNCACAAGLVRSNPTAIRQIGKACLKRTRLTVVTPGGGTAGRYRHWEHGPLHLKTASCTHRRRCGLRCEAPEEG